jgi:uncharacterized protein (DUF2132 family)
MTDTPKVKSNDPLHGLTLEKILTELVAFYGWLELSRIIEVRCFYNDPSIKSSLKFLRHTPWAREKVEKLYLDMKWQDAKSASRRRKKYT